MPLNKAGHSPAGGGADRPSAGAPGPVCVGIGASAGALGALERFFALLPPDTGLVFIVVQHLERRHPSVLAEILGKHTRMPVRQADDHERIHPSHVYIIPPDAELTLARGELRVARSTEPGLRTPIDVFFRSLAGDQGERAIAVVLSGAGSDGTAGLRAIKDQGGTTFAQSPETARYDSMPQSAIAAGLVDFIASIDEMPEQILAVARRLGDVQRETIEQLDAQVTAELGAISALLQRQTGHDFSRYKPGTLVRRIRRRIQLQQMSGVCDIGLPKMDGYAVAQAIRGDEELRTVRMVALTGYALPEDLAKARDAGFDVHLAKPPSIDKLDEVLRTLFA